MTKKRGPMKKSKTSAKAELAPSDPATPVFAFETKRWKQEFGGMLLKYGRAVRMGNLKAVELFANLQATINVLSEQLGGMTALEDAEAKHTIVFKTPRVVPDDPSYR